jgi:hypothetical protein
MGLRQATGQQHDYQTCTDPDCPRFACKVYKEGHGDGRADGHAEGYVEGYVDGARSG